MNKPHTETKLIDLERLILDRLDKKVEEVTEGEILKPHELAIIINACSFNGFIKLFADQDPYLCAAACKALQEKGLVTEFKDGTGMTSLVPKKLVDLYEITQDKISSSNIYLARKR